MCIINNIEVEKKRRSGTMQGEVDHQKVGKEKVTRSDYEG